ncbi:MAG: arylesterase [Campylobacteraceae bacterium]|jgi:lysophospholipase L1-like esterase|nr:arylesterase [Campylobacteraceae bacterium]
MKIWVIFALGFIAIFFIYSRAGAKIQIPQEAVILAFGDSITAGFGAKDGESYPARLSAMLNMRVINAGISGEDSRGGLLRLPSLLEEINPDIVILCHGGNDILRRYDPQETKQNLTKMINLIQNKNAALIFVGVPSLNGFLVGTNDMYDELAKEFNLIYDGSTLSQIVKSPALKSDQVHPNGDGYYLLAENLAKLFNRHFKTMNGQI